jgi:DNA polymerase III subunit epsilon
MQELLERPFSQVPLVVLDTETTGLHAGLGHRIVEIAAVRLETGPGSRWQETAQINQLINPGRPMDRGASRVNGITDQDLADKPSFAEVADLLLPILDGALLVAHNAAFDAEFVGLELYIRALSSGQRHDSVLANPWLCTLELARRHFHFGRNGLGHIARMLGVRTGRAHRALNDVYVTAEVARRMSQELARQRFETVGDLLHAQGGAIFTPPPPQPFLPRPVVEAMANGRSLEILYMGTSGESARRIDPLYPTEYEGTCYLIAYCHLRGAQRTFRLDRIFSAKLVD